MRPPPMMYPGVGSDTAAIAIDEEYRRIESLLRHRVNSMFQANTTIDKPMVMSRIDGRRCNQPVIRAQLETGNSDPSSGHVLVQAHAHRATFTPCLSRYITPCWY